MPEPWRYKEAEFLERVDGIVISSATLPGVVASGFPRRRFTLPHEIGHWLGLNHTDSEQRDANGNIICRDTDNIDDTSQHFLTDIEEQQKGKCLTEGEVITCDGRPDPITNFMISHH